jgi:hypothetical protein
MVAFNKAAVHDFLSTAKFKFVSGTDMTMQYLTEKKPLCTLVMEECNQAHSRAGIIWWEANLDWNQAFEEWCNQEYEGGIYGYRSTYITNSNNPGI